MQIFAKAQHEHGTCCYNMLLSNLKVKQHWTGIVFGSCTDFYLKSKSTTFEDNNKNSNFLSFGRWPQSKSLSTIWLGTFGGGFLKIYVSNKYCFRVLLWHIACFADFLPTYWFRASVNGFGEFSPLWLNLKRLWQFVHSLFTIWQNLKLTLAKIMLLGKFSFLYRAKYSSK